MKKLTIILILMAATVIHAQKEGDYPGVEKMRERVKAERIAFITEKVALTTDEAQKFWPIYNSFSTEIENIRKELRSLRMGRVRNLDKLSEKELDESFAKELGLDMDDYVLVTSFTHHPFYEQFVLEVPDNWALQSCYNVPLDEMMKIAEHAVSNGYGVAWASDVSEKGFSFRDGLAIVPEDESTIQVRGRDNAQFNNAGAEKVSSAFDAPVKEKNITQEMRQEGFDNYQTQDDHGMHFTGLVKDQIGTKYFIVKNSWGKGNDCDGYFYASEAYFKYKTTNIMLHKDGIPKDMRKKLGIK
jgi:hypothetical protein